MIKPLPIPPTYDEKSYAIVSKINEVVAAQNGQPYTGIDGATFAEEAIAQHHQRDEEYRKRKAKPWYVRLFS